MRIYKLVGLMIIVLLLLSGCFGKIELEQQAYVVVLGLDKAEDNLIKVTFQIANPEVGSSGTGASPNEPASDIISFTAPDILSAKEIANTVVPRKINFGHLRTIIISEELARTELFHHILGSAIVDPETRRETNLIVSKEKASKFIHANKPKLETRPHKYYMFMQQRWRDIGFVPYSNINRYFQRMSGELFLAIYATTEKDEETNQNEDKYKAGEIPQKSGDPVQMMGAAVFKYGQMIGTMTGEEMRVSLYMRHKSLGHTFVQSFPDPINNDFRISIRLTKPSHTKVRVKTKYPPEIDVTVPVRAQIFSDPSLVDYSSNIGHQKKLKEAIKKSLEEETMAFIKKSQEQFKGEPFLWHLYARRNFWTLKDYENYNWPEKFSEAKVNVDYQIMIESFGETIHPPKVKKAGKE